MRLTGIVAMLHTVRATWPLAGSPRPGSITGRSRGPGPGVPGWPGTVRPVNAADT